MLLVRFREGGAAGLFKTPLDELTGASHELVHLLDRAVVNQFEAELDAAQDDATRIAVLQDFLKAWLLNRPLDSLIEESIRKIRLGRGNLGILDLVRDLGTNPDTLEKRFRNLVGTTPKMFSRIVRIQSFVESYSPRFDLAEAALTAGFYDQSHLVKEFQTFTGQSPTTFFRTPRHW